MLHGVVLREIMLCMCIEVCSVMITFHIVNGPLSTSRNPIPFMAFDADWVQQEFEVWGS